MHRVRRGEGEGVGEVGEVGERERGREYGGERGRYVYRCEGGNKGEKRERERRGRGREEEGEGVREGRREGRSKTRFLAQLGGLTDNAPWHMALISTSCNGALWTGKREGGHRGKGGGEGW